MKGKERIFQFLPVLLVLLFLAAAPAGGTCGNDCTGDAASCGLTVTGGVPVVYSCGTKETITARYYSLSDDSLNFVKVTLPDGKVYTLPAVLSASGVRYTDDFELVWWTKGDTAFAEKRQENGEWKTLYEECRIVPEKK